MNIKHLVERISSVVKLSSIYAGSNLLGRSIPFLMLPVLTRYLSPADYGLIAIFYIIHDGIWPLTSMSTSGAVCRAYFDRKTNNFVFSSYISNALFVNFTLFLVITIFVFLLRGYIYQRLSFPLLWLLAIPILAYASSIISVKQKLWIFQNKPLLFGIFNVSQITFNITLSVLLVVVFSMDWRGRIIGIGAAEILFSIMAFILLIREYKIKFSLNAEYVKDILKFGFPLVPYSVGTLVMTSADKYFLKTLEGLSILGVYAVGYAIGQVVIFIASSIDTAISPKLYNKLGQPKEDVEEEIVRYMYLYFFFLTILALLVTLTSPYILRFWVGSEFQSASQFVFWICLGNVFFGMYRVFSQFITYTKKTYLLTWSVFIAAPLTIVANYILIKMNGPIGAAQAFFVGYLLFLLITWGFVQRLYSMPWLKIFWSGKGNFIKKYETR